MTSEDLFPTRMEQDQKRFTRLDPVIHARNQDRWSGPLGEEALSRYERDGFLWFEGFFSQERVRPFFDELKEMAKDMDLPFLGAVPINMALRAHSDEGTPLANFDNDPQLCAELEAVVKNLAGQVSIHTLSDEAQQPTLSVSEG